MQPSGRVLPSCSCFFFYWSLLCFLDIFFFGVKLSVSYPTSIWGTGILLFVWVVTVDLFGMVDLAGSYGTATISLREIYLCFVYFIRYVINFRKIYFRFVYFILLCNKISEKYTSALYILVVYVIQFKRNILLLCILYSIM